jgi:ribosome modulation factor
MHGISKAYEKYYHAGKAAYFDGQSREACPYGKSQMTERGFWFAGWDDADIETVGFGHFRRDEDDR